MVVLTIVLLQDGSALRALPKISTHCVRLQDVGLRPPKIQHSPRGGIPQFS
jgi:hypothetical protein